MYYTCRPKITLGLEREFSFFIFPHTLCRAPGPEYIQWCPKCGPFVTLEVILYAPSPQYENGNNFVFPAQG